jgi:hypothetical protein
VPKKKKSDAAFLARVAGWKANFGVNAVPNQWIFRMLTTEISATGHRRQVRRTRVTVITDARAAARDPNRFALQRREIPAYFDPIPPLPLA